MYVTRTWPRLAMYARRTCHRAPFEVRREKKELCRNCPRGVEDSRQVVTGPPDIRAFQSGYVNADLAVLVRYIGECKVSNTI